MQGSGATQKINPQIYRYKERAQIRKDQRHDHSKPRNKRDYTQQRKLKEKFLVFSS
jgi:hypothetical protein